LLSIVHQSPRYVVIDKPSGLLSVPGKGEANKDCVAARVARLFPSATGPLIVHRLDMDTSGLIVLGLDPEAQRDLSGQFERREVDKAYIALVDGIVRGNSGTIDVPMRTDIDNRPYQIIDHVHGKPSLTHWTVLALETDRTRLRMVPHTGRTHQLRVHAAHIGHPIIGDVLYGPIPDRAAAGRLMLHAAELSFREPGTRQPVSFHSRAPF
jgi:tRNA pseudouridine32 synthase/23S rRNA pseudouridine746 synthase